MGVLWVLAKPRDGNKPCLDGNKPRPDGNNPTSDGINEFNGPNHSGIPPKVWEWNKESESFF